MQHKLFNALFTIALAAVVTIFHSGCTQLINRPSHNQQTITLVPSVLQPTTTATKMPIPTFTISPTLTKTLQPLATVTWTPIVTLPPEQAQEALLGYYENNGGCQLPCWWGIIPGKTSWLWARNFLSPLANEIGPFEKADYSIYDYSFKIPDEIAISPDFRYFEPSLWINNNQVVIITLNGGSIQRGFDYSLSGLLKQFGQPNEIWIDATTDTQDVPHYEINLFYPKAGLSLNATGEGQVRENFLIICPQEFRRGTFPPAISVFSPDENFSFDTYHSAISRGDLTNNFRLLREVAVGFDENDFFRAYINPSNEKCIEIDIEKLK